MNSLFTKFQTYLLTEKRVATNTFAAYARDTNQFSLYLQTKNLTLEALTSADIKEYLRYLNHELNLTARSVTRKICALKVFFDYATTHHGLRNITEDIVFPKLEKKLPEFLSEDEVRLLLTQAQKDNSDLGKRNSLLLYMLYTTGMRISELIAIELSHLHFDTGLLDVKGKGGKCRIIPLPQPVIATLKEYIQTVHASFMQQARLQTDFLFPVLYGGSIKAITRQAVWGILKQLCAKSGIKRSIFPHQLRHSLATHMLKNGVDLRSLQLLLGHENVATVQIYTHVDTSYLRAIYDKKSIHAHD